MACESGCQFLNTKGVVKPAGIPVNEVLVYRNAADLGAQRRFLCSFFESTCLWISATTLQVRSLAPPEVWLHFIAFFYFPCYN